MEPTHVRVFIEQFHDYLVPKLDVYEQAIYLYVFRHSRLIGLDEAAIGFKSTRKRISFGIGRAGTPPSEHVIYEKLQSLTRKGFLEILASERKGTRVRLKLPSEIPGIIVLSQQVAAVDIEEMDFFNPPENRRAILEREGRQCFYCLRKLDDSNYVIEHVLSRPSGNNSYRNVVAACLSCNNKKGSTAAERFLQLLYREGYLQDRELEGRLECLRLLRAGELKPLTRK